MMLRGSLKTQPLSASVLILTSLVLAACQSEPPGGPLRLTVDATGPTRVVQRINDAAQRCWMRSSERSFRPYRVIPEVDTTAGKPRVLIVRADAAQGLPQLVIQADKSPVEIVTYGPLAAKPISNRINSDVSRWALGEQKC